MNLYILRHGIASAPGEDGLPKNLPDAERPLSVKGKQRLWGATGAMRKMEVVLDTVMSSPLLRARQTAQIVTEAMELRRALVLTDNLAPEGSTKALVEQINEIGPRAKSILLVGHEPYLSRLIALLVAGDADAEFDLKKGGLAKLEIAKLKHGRCAMLEWLLTPKQMVLIK